MMEMQEQVSTLSQFVEPRRSLSHSVEAETLIKGSSDQLKIAKLSDQDDIEAYLVTFERLMEAYMVPNNAGLSSWHHSCQGARNKHTHPCPVSSVETTVK